MKHRIRKLVSWDRECWVVEECTTCYPPCGTWLAAPLNFSVSLNEQPEFTTEEEASDALALYLLGVDHPDQNHPLEPAIHQSNVC